MPEFKQEPDSMQEDLPEIPVKLEGMDETTVMFPDITTEYGDNILQEISNQMLPMDFPTSDLAQEDNKSSDQPPVIAPVASEGQESSMESHSASTMVLEDFLQKFPTVHFLPSEFVCDTNSSDPSQSTQPSDSTQPLQPLQSSQSQKKREKGPQTIAGYLINTEETVSSSQESQETPQEVFKRPRDPDDGHSFRNNKRMRRDENDNEHTEQQQAESSQDTQSTIDDQLEAGLDEIHAQIEGFNDSEADITTDNMSEMEVNQEDMPFPNLAEDIDFDVEAMLKRSNQGIQTGCMGDKQRQKYIIERKLVLQTIKALNDCLQNAPVGVTERDEDPQGLAVPLMPHQRLAMRWMKWREEQCPCSGGILADEMGLGKTLQMIALIVAAKNTKKAKMLAENPDWVDEEPYEDTDDWGSLDVRERYEGRTLVVCPPSLMEQWAREVSSKCNRGVLCSYTYHGVENKQITEGQLTKYDVVITTYNTVTMEYNSHMRIDDDKEVRLYNIHWDRIVLDEAHVIRNHRGKICDAICELKGKNKWAITGTPIQNKQGDFFPLLKFLNCEPFVDYSLWNRWVNKGKMGSQRLVVITKTLMLRRTKKELVNKGYITDLPEKRFQIVNVELDREEKMVYQKLLLYSQSFFLEYLKQKEEKEQEKLYPRSFHSSTSLIAQHVPKKLSKAMRVMLRHHSHKFSSEYLLVLIMRLRQLCCHPALIKAMLDKEDTDLDDIEGDRDIQKMDDTILEYITKLVDESDEGDDDGDGDGFDIDETTARNLMTSGNPLFNDERKGAKLRAILNTIQNILNVGEKVVVVSQWTSFLQVIGNNLAKMPDANFAVFSGNTKLADRQVMVDRINDYDDRLNVLLLSLTAGAVGLNLVGANHLLIIDNHWNPQLELQAQDRLHRFGQYNDVHIYKFICNNTIEEKIQILQAEKLKVAAKVLEGKVASNLTMKDLATLFS